MTKKISLLFAALLLIVTNTAMAKNTIDAGPLVNKKAPPITVINAKKQSVNIEQLRGDKGLIILFFRSADWCPFCKKHLVELNDTAKKFTQLGYGLAAISYDETDILKSFTKERNITYPLLSDQDAKTMIDYNILHQDYAMDDDNYGIPYPGVVVIDNKGNVTHKHFFEGYKKRVKFAKLYQQLKNEQ